MGKLRLSIYTILMMTLSFFSITTLSYTLWPLNLPINRILGFLVFIEVIFLIIKTLKKQDLFLGLFFLFISILSFINCTDIAVNLTDLIYYFITIFIIFKLSDQSIRNQMHNALINIKKINKYVILIDIILIISGFFFSSTYTYTWGSAGYYRGFTPEAHTMCSGICLMLALFLFQIKDRATKFFDYIILAVGIYAIFESGARIYIVSVFIIIILLFKYCVKSYLKIIFVPLAIISLLYLFLHSGMIDKFNFLKGNVYISNDVSVQFTNGRTEFWLIDLKEFQSLRPLYQLFGKGFDYVYFVNLDQCGLKIWAHNDIINLLLSVGYIGTIIYVYIFYKLLKSCKLEKNKISIIFLLLIYCISVMLINGFFIYQHYLYSFVVLFLFLIKRRKKFD